MYPFKSTHTFPVHCWKALCKVYKCKDAHFSGNCLVMSLIFLKSAPNPNPASLSIEGKGASADSICIQGTFLLNLSTCLYLLKIGICPEHLLDMICSIYLPELSSVWTHEPPEKYLTFIFATPRNMTHREILGIADMRGCWHPAHVLLSSIILLHAFGFQGKSLWPPAWKATLAMEACSVHAWGRPEGLGVNAAPSGCQQWRMGVGGYTPQLPYPWGGTTLRHVVHCLAEAHDRTDGQSPTTVRLSWACLCIGFLPFHVSLCPFPTSAFWDGSQINYLHPCLVSRSAYGGPSAKITQQMFSVICMGLSAPQTWTMKGLILGNAGIKMTLELCFLNTPHIPP